MVDILMDSLAGMTGYVTPLTPPPTPGKSDGGTKRKIAKVKGLHKQQRDGHNVTNKKRVGDAEREVELLEKERKRRTRQRKKASKKRRKEERLRKEKESMAIPIPVTPSLSKVVKTAHCDTSITAQLANSAWEEQKMNIIAPPPRTGTQSTSPWRHSPNRLPAYNDFFPTKVNVDIESGAHSPPRMKERSLKSEDSALVIGKAFAFIQAMQQEQVQLCMQTQVLEGVLDKLRSTAFKLDVKRIQMHEQLVCLISSLCHDLFIAEFAFRDVLDENREEEAFDLRECLGKLKCDVGMLVEVHDQEVGRVYQGLDDGAELRKVIEGVRQW
ncbi:hypothetical protein BKA66DRAFT_477210 [Pyrenochaeta sp. MPI-SDFR-AT-0127]|nr:hypothetical protein BKA66DRAFT_477210 [Pyrenochaeta sp. MPI-SDFR-AT-0127]